MGVGGGGWRRGELVYQAGIRSPGPRKVECAFHVIQKVPNLWSASLNFKLNLAFLQVIIIAF